VNVERPGGVKLKPIFQINRYGSSLDAVRKSRGCLKTGYNYQAATLDGVSSGRARNGKPSFHTISQDYFAREAHHHFISEAVIFCLLAMVTILPLLNAVSEIVWLIRSGGRPL
jgi:hypothetical protein